MGNSRRNNADFQAKYQSKNIRNYVKTQILNYYVFTMENFITVHNVLILVSMIGSLNTSVQKTLTSRHLNHTSEYHASVQVCCSDRKERSSENNQMAKKGNQQGRKGNRRLRKTDKKMKGLESSASKDPRKRGREIGKESMQNIINIYYVGTPAEVKDVISKWERELNANIENEESIRMGDNSQRSR